MLLRWIRSWRRSRTLEGVGEKPRWVNVPGHVETPNQTESPITGHRAAAFAWRFASRTMVQDWYLRDDREREVVEELGRGVFGSDLIVKTKWGRLLVLRESLRVVAPGHTSGLVSLYKPLPAEYAWVMERARDAPVELQEIALCAGDPVTVQGYVKAFDDPRARSAYRADGRERPDFVTCPDRGSVRVIDETLSR